MLGSHNFWGRALQLMLLGQEWCMYRDTLGSTIFFYLLVFLSSLPCEEKKVLRWLGNVLFGYLTPLQDVLVRHKQKTPMPCNQTVIKQEQPSLDDVHASHLVGFPQCFFCPRQSISLALWVGCATPFSYGDWLELWFTEMSYELISR